MSVFKKGPDYIDAAWLAAFGRSVCRNLDTYMVDPATVYETFAVHAAQSDLAIIEGNRGLFDGRDIEGTNSTAELAKMLKAPVVLVVDTTKTTRTVAAIVKGCATFDPDVEIAGVILNRVAGKRHQRVVTESIEKYCDLPVLGALPKLGANNQLIPSRHLGLVTPAEFGEDSALDARMRDIAEKYLDIDRLLKIARSAELLEVPLQKKPTKTGPTVRIGYFRDPVFTFYYPENLEALDAQGAELVPISSLDDSSLPAIDALYIGGGFPETHAERLAGNRAMMQSVKDAAENDLPVYAECGGLIYLSRSITWGARTHKMAGLFSIDLKMNSKPVGHGYTKAKIDRSNPFFSVGSIVKGHEFHYSGKVTEETEEATCMSMETGVGLGDSRDGLMYKNSLACYTHVHADGVRDWAAAMVNAARRYRSAEAGQENTKFRNTDNTGHETGPGDLAFAGV